MGKTHKSSKYVSIGDDLIAELRSGNLSKMTSFFTREEIASRYNIAPLTAYKILKHIESKGYIRCGRGHRAEIVYSKLNDLTQGNILKQRIGLLVPKFDEYTPSDGLAWLIMALQKRLTDDGHDFKLLHMEGLWQENPNSYTGFILLEMIETIKPFIEKLMEYNLPFSALSFNQLEPSVVYAMPRCYVLQLALYLMKHKVTKILTFRGPQRNIEASFSIKIETNLKDIFDIHNYQIEIVNTPNMDFENKNSKAIIYDILERYKKEKLGIITRNPLFAKVVSNELGRLNLIINKNYVIATYGVAPGMNPPISYINFKSEEVVDNLIGILYRQIASNTCYDPGALVMPELVII